MTEKYAARWRQFLNAWNEDLREKRHEFANYVYEHRSSLDQNSYRYGHFLPLEREETICHDLISYQGSVTLTYLKECAAALKDWSNYHSQMIHKSSDPQAELAYSRGDQAALEKIYLTFPEIKNDTI